MGTIHCQAPYKERAIRALAAALIFNATSMADTTFALLNCIPLSWNGQGTKCYLLGAGSVQCFTPWQLALLVFAVIVVLALTTVWVHSTKVTTKPKWTQPVMTYIASSPFTESRNYW
jgi:hypothetical protein